MAKEDTLEFPGLVKELLPNATFRVEVGQGGGTQWAELGHEPA